MSAPAIAETRIITAAEFKAKCLALLDEVRDHNLKVVVTKRGKVVAELSQPKQEEKPFRSIWGLAPNGRILGDIMRPLDWGDPAEKWARVNGNTGKRRRGSNG